jgi:hypothetical protein
VWKLGGFLFDVVADIAGIPKDLCENWMNFHFYASISEDLITGLECPLIRGDKDDINIEILDCFFCFLAL